MQQANGPNFADRCEALLEKAAGGRYMPFKEIAAYSVGGIGAYFIITVVRRYLFPLVILLSATRLVLNQPKFITLCNCDLSNFPDDSFACKYH